MGQLAVTANESDGSNITGKADADQDDTRFVPSGLNAPASPQGASPRPASRHHASPLGYRPQAVVERAAMDLRRGLPIVMLGAKGPALVAAAETLTPEVLSWMDAQTGGADMVLALTHTRARTLKIRLYTEDVVGLPMAPPSRNPDTDRAMVSRIRKIVDPSDDLSAPMQGPYTSLRTLPPLPLGHGIRLAKIGALLPAILAAPLDMTGDAAAMWSAREALVPVPEDALDTYDLAITESLQAISRAQVPLAGAPETRIIAFRGMAGGPEHYAIVIGDPGAEAAPLVRLHSECFTGDLLGSLKCDCGEQLRGAIERISAEGSGVLLYLAHEGRGIGMMNKLRAYALQDQGFDTVEANERLGFEVDERAYQPAAEMLKRLGITAVRLLTNNPAKAHALEANGVAVAGRVAHAFKANPHNAHYLKVKADKTGHDLDIDALTRDMNDGEAANREDEYR